MALQCKRCGQSLKLSELCTHLIEVHQLGLGYPKIELAEIEEHYEDKTEPEVPLSHITLTKLVKTCDMCPSQWDAWGNDGTKYYIRYRWGTFRVDKVSPRGWEYNETLYETKTGDPMEGFMEEEDMLKLTGFIYKP